MRRRVLIMGHPLTLPTIDAGALPVERAFHVMVRRPDRLVCALRRYLHLHSFIQRMSTDPDCASFAHIGGRLPRPSLRAHQPGRRHRAGPVWPRGAESHYQGRHVCVYVCTCVRMYPCSRQTHTQPGEQLILSSHIHPHPHSQVREIRGGSILFDTGNLGGNLFEVVFISDVRARC